MKKLTSKQLKMIRNILIIVGIVITVMLWIMLPDTFRNTKMFHVGSGESGTKIGALIILFFPLAALIPDMGKEELHSNDPNEREEIAEKRAKNDALRQIAVAVGMDLVAWGIMGLAVLVL